MAPTFETALLTRLTADSTLETAYAWLCRQGREQGPNSRVWDLRFHWPAIKSQLQRDLRAGRFELGPTRTFVDAEGEGREMREAIDALVMHAMAQKLTPVLEPLIPAACTHVAGHGGAKAAIRQVLAALPQHPFVFKTDVQRYYASIDQVVLMEQVAAQVSEPIIQRLIWQAIRRTTWEDGRYREHRRGIALGCPLSPLLGGLHLAEVDQAMSDRRWFYVRFMDDLLVLAPSRPKIRAAVKRLHGLFDALHLRMHPDKTFIGRWEKGFEFLGLRMETAWAVSAAPASEPDAKTRAAPTDPPVRGQPTLGEVLATPPSCRVDVVTLPRKASVDHDATSPARLIRLTPARASWERFVARTRRLYEQWAPSARLDAYVRHWLVWFTSGLRGFSIASQSLAF